MKNIFRSLMALMVFVGISVVVSCSKEQIPSEAPSSEGRLKNQAGIANENNPFDYCGLIHNEILDFIIQNNQHPSSEDIFSLTQQYLLEKHNVSSNLTFSDFSSGYHMILEFIVDAFLRGDSFHGIVSDGVVANTLDMLVDYSNSILIANTLPLPQEYARYLIERESEILEDRKGASDAHDAVSEHNVSLGTLAIARYSYAYWYDVVNNAQNAWNNVKPSSKRQDGDGNEKPGFFKKLWNGICEVSEVVVKAAITPVVDATGFAYGAVTNSGPVSPSSPGFGLDGTWLDSAIEVAGDWSGNIWE